MAYSSTRFIRHGQLGRRTNAQPQRTAPCPLANAVSPLPILNARNGGVSIVKMEAAGDGGTTLTSAMEPYNFAPVIGSGNKIVWSEANRLLRLPSLAAHLFWQQQQPLNAQITTERALRHGPERLIGGRAGASNRNGAARTRRAQMQLTRTTRARRHTSLSYLAKSSDTQNDTT